MKQNKNPGRILKMPCGSSKKRAVFREYSCSVINHVVEMIKKDEN